MSEIPITFFHALVAIVIFIVVNWLGKHSTMFGYETMGGLTDQEPPTVFNVFFRVVTPLVLLVVISAGLYRCKMDGLVQNIHFSIPLYILFRIFFNLLRGRFLLIPWLKIVLQSVLLIGFSQLTYNELISKKQFLLPDASSIGNEVWLAIAVYIYTIASKVQIGNKGVIKRKKKYIISQMKHFQSEYGSLLKSYSDGFRSLVYAVMVYENFNRPKLFRLVELLLFKVKKANTLGVMQVKTNEIISDEESVKLGIDKLYNCYLELLENKDTWWSEYTGVKSNATLRNEEESLIHDILVKYNPCGDYVREVDSIRSEIIDLMYKGVNTHLHPELRES